MQPQFVTSLKYSKSVYAFTEQGVAMLSSVLHSKQAVHVNIAIMRAFVKLRYMIGTHRQLAAKMSEVEKRLDKHDKDIILVFDAIRRLMAVSAPKPDPSPEDSYKRTKVGFVVDRHV